ncbi:structural polyprotein [Wolffia australiana]
MCFVFRSCPGLRRAMGLQLNGLMNALFFLVGFCASLVLGRSHGEFGHGEERMLLSFKEVHNNASFRCTPSGPCLPCEYSEKKDPNYRCSETGYRVPLKCLQIKDEAKNRTGKRSGRSLNEQQSGDKENAGRWWWHLRWRRRLLDVSDTQDKKVSYTTYRSCLTPQPEEKLSLLGFEIIMVSLLLASSFFIYVRQKRNVPFLGMSPDRVPFGSSRR